jgi:DNA topoisomerase III
MPRRSSGIAWMIAYAQSLARGKNVTLPEGYERDFKACRRFLDEHAR